LKFLVELGLSERFKCPEQLTGSRIDRCYGHDDNYTETNVFAQKVASRLAWLQNRERDKEASFQQENSSSEKVAS
jgi:hypothetical protein